VLALHASGFRVQLAPGARDDDRGTTWPLSGTTAPPGTVVRLVVDR
jgi:hypothetical protein